MIPKFSQARILVVGDVMLDRYWHGSVSRISPEAPVPIVKVENEDMRVGGAGNVALNVASLGSSVRLLALVGDDDLAGVVENGLLAKGVGCILKRVSGNQTISKLRILSRHQQLIRLDFEDRFPSSNASALFSDFRSNLEDTDVVILSDYAKGTLDDCRGLISDARSAKVKVVVDPKGADFSRYRGATVVTPNLSEFEAVVGTCENDADVVRRGIDLREHLDVDALLITRSEKGMTLLARGHEVIHLPAQAREVFDVTGAGDTVVAVLASSLAAGSSIEVAVGLSNVAAGIVVSKLGTAVVTSEEIDFAVNGMGIIDSRGIYGEDELFEKVLAARLAGDRVVMTNGCFDILHPGHVDYLEKARGLGDRLIVAINDDASVSRLKGRDRPVNSLETRMRMLSAMKCVDWVVPFSEDTPERLICRLLPDVLVKGGDYAVDQVAGGKCVSDAGGVVKILGFVHGHSTTGLIGRIRKGSSSGREAASGEDG